MNRSRAKNFAAIGYRWLWAAVLGLGWALAGLAQSTDPSAPTLLPANPFNGTIRARDNASYYYVCTASPGAITVSLPVKTTGNLSQLDLEIYDASNRVIAKLDATSSGSPQEAKFSLSSQQRLLIKLSGFRSNDAGSFTLRLKGQVSLAGGLAAPPANHEPANRTSQPPGAAKDTLPPSVEELMRLPSRNAMTSGALTTVPDRSVFLEYLTKRLQENRSPYKTAAEIFSSLQTAVTDNSPPSESGRPNVPQYGAIQAAGHEGGDFIFIRRP